MKKLFIFLFVSFLGISVYSQSAFSDRRPGSDWLFSVGVNTIANNGTRNPIEDISDNGSKFAFKYPLALSIERKWTKYLYIEQDLTLNGFTEGEYIDHGRPDKDLFYFSTNTYIKYYFDRHIFTNTDWLNLYAGGGIGIFNLEELNTSANVTAGLIVWVSDRVGIRLSTVGKFAFAADSRKYDNNHYMFLLQGTFRL